MGVGRSVFLCGEMFVIIVKHIEKASVESCYVCHGVCFGKCAGSRKGESDLQASYVKKEGKTNYAILT